MKSRIRVACIVAWLTILSLAGPSEAVRFKYEDLGNLGSNHHYNNQSGREAGINDAGQVVGGSYTAGGVRQAFVKSPGQPMVNLGDIPGSLGSHAYGINNSGVIAGIYFDNSGYHACKWTPVGATYNRTDLLANSFSEARGINDSGNAVGSDYSSGEAYLFPAAGSPVALPNLPGSTTGCAMGINNSGTMVGFSPNSSDQATACEWYWFPYLHRYLVQDLFGIPNSRASAINAAGQAVGYATISGKQHAVLKMPGQPFQDLGVLPLADYSIAYDINDSSWVVGKPEFLWTPAAGLKNLKDLVVNLPAEVYYILPMAINKRGEIAGYSYFVDGLHGGAFKLTPLGGPPSALLLLD